MLILLIYDASSSAVLVTPVAAIAQQSVPATVTPVFIFPNNIKSLLDKILRFLSYLRSRFKMMVDTQTYTL